MSDFKWRHYQGDLILGCVRWYWKPTMGYSWRVDETYVKVKGKWTYLYRAIDKHGDTIDFYLSSTRGRNRRSEKNGLKMLVPLMVF